MAKQVNKIFKDEVARASFGIISGMIILIVVSFFSIRPTIIAIVNNKNQIEELTPLVSELEVKKNNLIKAQENFEKIYNQIENLNYAIDNKSNLVENLKIIEKISSELNSNNYVALIEKISIENLMEDQEVESLEALELKKLDVKLRLIGDYNSLKLFVQMLNENLRSFKIDQVVFSIPKKERSNNDLINAELAITINYFN